MAAFPDIACQQVKADKQGGRGLAVILHRFQSGDGTTVLSALGGNHRAELLDRFEARRIGCIRVTDGGVQIPVFECGIGQCGVAITHVHLSPFPWFCQCRCGRSVRSTVFSNASVWFCRKK